MANNCGECTYLDLNTGDVYGKFWCDSKSERHLANEIACNRFCKAYSRDSSEADSAYNYSVDHNNGGCYITTILCKILNLPDNNKYLTSIRDFRNNFLQKDEKYKPLLVEYDIIGPSISEALNNDPINKTISKICFEKYIIPITNHINNKNHENAIDLYISMTNTL